MMIRPYFLNYHQIIVLGLCFTAVASAKTTPVNEIHVTLLGQPCLLEGPFDEKTLTAIHSIGPAQVSPMITTVDFENIKAATNALAKIRSSKGLPPLFDRYKEKLSKRLEAQLAFLEALDAARKTRKSQPLEKLGQRFMLEPKRTQFVKMFKKLDSSSWGGTKFREISDQLLDFYNQNIEPDPEEEFHRALKKMNVQYACSFEEAEGAGAD